MNDKPLATIAMMTYNQEMYVREAVRGLLSQTYEPLEIVISDDHSTDKTWDKINEEVDAYKAHDGIHKNIVLNRNEANLGIAKNFSKMQSLSHGVLIAAAAGDDVSLPERVETIVNAWIQDGKRAAAVSHSGYTIDVNGKKLGTVRRATLDAPLGAVMAWRAFPELHFPNVDSPGAVEDAICSYRAAMLGGILEIADKLVLYRVGSGETSILSGQRRPAINGMNGWARSFPQVRSDLEYLRDRIGEDRYEFFKAKIESESTYYTAYVKLLTAQSYRERYNAYKVIEPRNRQFKARLLIVLYLLPRTIGDVMLNTGTFLKTTIKRIKAYI